MNQEGAAKNRRLAEQIMAWYRQNKRPLPWRQTTDPYKIWLSEIILQQTRVQQGLPYYNRFVEHYPKVEALANAPEQDILRLWQGLGYYTRARNLHKCAQIIACNFGGIFPKTYVELMQLPGVGKYTAAAIASFAYGEVVPVVDGNVYRVLARLYAEPTDISSSKAFSVFFNLAQNLIDQQQPAEFNQAIMEFGAMQCTPKKPLCLYCPVKNYCEAYTLNMQQEFPVKLKKTKVTDRYLHYMVITDENGQVYMQQRTGNDIWKGLFQFPLLAYSQPEINREELPLQPQLESPLYKHQLSHQSLYVRFYHYKVDSRKASEQLLPSTLANPASKENNEGWYSIKQVENLPKPILIQNYLKEAGFYLN